MLNITCRHGLKVEPEEVLHSYYNSTTWLAVFFSLFLELRTDFAAVIEMYETALCALSDMKDVAKIWKGLVLAELQIRCVKLTSTTLILFISLPNHMFDHLLELPH